MKTAKRILTLFIIVISFSTFSQNADYTYNKQPTYLDALRLEQIIEANNNADAIGDHKESTNLNAEYYKILGKYIDTAELDIHPFLKDYKIDITPKLSEEQIRNKTQAYNNAMNLSGASSDEKPAEEISQTSSIPMNWEAAAINGIANFMAGRFKEELLHLGIDQMFKRISVRDSSLIGAVFPKTLAHIIDLRLNGDNAYYTADLLYLRELVQLDMQNLPTNLVDNLDKIFLKLEMKPNLKDGIVLTSGLVKYAEMGVPVDQLLTYVSDTSLYSSDSSIVSQLVNITDLLSQAFKDKAGTGRTWINPLITVPNVSGDKSKAITKIFYGLLYSQLIATKQFEDGFVKITKGMTPANAKAKISKVMQNVSLAVNQFEMIGNLLKENNYEIQNVSQAMTVINELVGAVQSTSIALKSIDPKLAKFDSVVGVVREYISFTESLIEKNYRSAIPKLAAIFGAYADDNVEMSRILGFVAGLGDVKDDEDMEALLQSYALPIGSASIKRSSYFNLSVNGYVGFTGGLERAFAVETKNNQDKGNIGLTAPIGIAMTFGRGNVTLFASIFDLGSIVNQRLDNDTTSYVDLRFEHFFSPGAYLFWNIKNTPLSLGAGVSYIPNLRTIKYEDGNTTIGESGLNVMRLNVTLVVDIPFFTLYNRPMRSEGYKKAIAGIKGDYKKDMDQAKKEEEEKKEKKKAIRRERRMML